MSLSTGDWDELAVGSKGSELGLVGAVMVRRGGGRIDNNDGMMVLQSNQ